MDERRLWEAVRQSLLALAREQPVIVFLDDLHWADASTLGMLGYLIRRATDEPVTLVAAARRSMPHSSLRALLEALAREGRLVRLTLSRLQPGDVMSVARHLSPTHADTLAEWLMRTSEGNPYILAEVVRYARESGLLLASGAMELDTLSVTPVVACCASNASSTAKAWTFVFWLRF